jgi:phosphonate transport system permease protein
VLGFPLALFFGVLGSEQVTPFPFNFIFRGMMSAIRAIPALVWILIYVPLAGINEVSAVLAIATDTVGNLGRLFTDELEEIEDGPIEAIQSTGASRPQVIGFGMLSQVSTSYVAWTLYILEINTRIAISLGVVGAGGIGRYIRLRQDLFKYQKAAAGIIMVFVIVISVELLSSRIRARLRPDEHESKSLWDAIKGLADGNKWLGTGSNR